MRSKGEGIKCGVVEWVKRNSLRWFGHVERMKDDDLCLVSFGDLGLKTGIWVSGVEFGPKG